MTERIRFQQLDALQGLPEQYDIITTFDVIHDSAKPRELLRSICAALQPNGRYVCLEINPIAVCWHIPTMKHWALAVYWRSMPPRGVETYLFTDTRGERGWLESKEEYPGVEALGKMREAGLQAAAKVLGIHQDDSLNYLDGELDQARSAGGNLQQAAGRAS